jgi:hypothetical protein
MSTANENLISNSAAGCPPPAGPGRLLARALAAA